jgi:hypothetical protein
MSSTDTKARQLLERQVSTVDDLAEWSRECADLIESGENMGYFSGECLDIAIGCVVAFPDAGNLFSRLGSTPKNVWGQVSPPAVARRLRECYRWANQQELESADKIPADIPAEYRAGGTEDGYPLTTRFIDNVFHISKSTVTRNATDKIDHPHHKTAFVYAWSWLCEYCRDNDKDAVEILSRWQRPPKDRCS